MESICSTSTPSSRGWSRVSSSSRWSGSISGASGVWRSKGNRMVAARQPRDEPVLEARGIGKRYGSVSALENVDFEAYPGEIVALLGDNGAGKSTLIKILSGAIRPDSGTIKLHGREVEFHGPRDARSSGIETVYQDLALAPDLDVASNLFLGREILMPGPLGALRIVNQKAMRQQAEQHLRDLRVRLKSARQA